MFKLKQVVIAISPLNCLLSDSGASTVSCKSTGCNHSIVECLMLGGTLDILYSNLPSMGREALQLDLAAQASSILALSTPREEASTAVQDNLCKAGCSFDP